MNKLSKLIIKVSSQSLILAQIALNSVLVTVYLTGFLGNKFLSIGWISIIVISLLILIDTHVSANSKPNPSTIISQLIFGYSYNSVRWWLSATFVLSFLAYIPVFGYIALFFALKYSIDDIVWLWNQLGNSNSSNYSSKAKSKTKENFIDVEPKN